MDQSQQQSFAITLFLLKFDCLIIHMLQNKSRQYMGPQCELHEECTRITMLSIIKMFIFLNIFYI